MGKTDQNTKVTSADFERKSKYDKDLKFVKKTNDSRFGDIKVLEDPKTNEKFLLKEKVSNSEDHAKKDIQHCMTRMGLNHDNLQRMLDWSSHTKSDWCSKYFTVRGYYQMPEHDLLSLMKTLRTSGGHFSHKELTTMSYQMLKALKFLHEANVTFDDFRPLYVGSSEKRDSFYLLDRLNSAPSDVSKLQANNLLQSGKSLYMSPQLFEGILSKNKNAVDNHKNDSWGLGWTVLECGLLDKDLQKAYDRTSKKFNEDELRGFLSEFRDRYGHDNSLLCDMVDSLLQVEEAKRHSPLDLLELVPPYDNILAHFATLIGSSYTHVSHPCETTEEVIAPVRKEVTVESVHRPAHTEVVRSEPRVVQSHGHTHGSHLNQSRVISTTIKRMDPKTGEVLHEEKKEGDVKFESFNLHHGENVVRASHHHGENVVKTSPHHGENVVRTSHHHGNVVRREPVVSHHHGGNVVRREPVVSHHHHGGNVIRKEGLQTSHHHHGGNVVRREGVVSSHHHHGGNVVRREPVVSHHHHGGHGNYVRTEGLQSSHHHFGGNEVRYSHVQTGHHHHKPNSTVKVIKDQGEIEAYLKRKHESEFKHEEVVVVAQEEVAHSEPEANCEEMEHVEDNYEQVQAQEEFNDHQEMNQMNYDEQAEMQQFESEEQQMFDNQMQQQQEFDQAQFEQQIYEQQQQQQQQQENCVQQD